jgi:hypothetical protein
VTEREPVAIAQAQRLGPKTALGMGLAAGVTAANLYYSQFKRLRPRQPDLEKH